MSDNSIGTGVFIGWENTETVGIKDALRQLVSSFVSYATDIKEVSGVNQDKVFDELINNKVFNMEAKEAMGKLKKDSSKYTNLTKKYSDLIK